MEGIKAVALINKVMGYFIRKLLSVFVSFLARLIHGCQGRLPLRLSYIVLSDPLTPWKESSEIGFRQRAWDALSLSPMETPFTPLVQTVISFLRIISERPSTPPPFSH